MQDLYERRQAKLEYYRQQYEQQPRQAYVAGRCSSDVGEDEIDSAMNTNAVWHTDTVSFVHFDFIYSCITIFARRKDYSFVLAWYVGKITESQG